MINRIFGQYNYKNSGEPLKITAGFDGISRFSADNSFHFSELYDAVAYSFFLGIDYHLSNVDGLSVSFSTVLDTGEFSGKNKLAFKSGCAEAVS